MLPSNSNNNSALSLSLLRIRALGGWGMCKVLWRLVMANAQIQFHSAIKMEMGEFLIGTFQSFAEVTTKGSNKRKPLNWFLID